LGHFGKGREIGEEDGHFDDAPFLDVGPAPVAEIGIARASPYPDGTKDDAHRSGQERAADFALSGQVEGGGGDHAAPTNGKDVLEAVAQIEAADLFDGLPAMRLQQPTYLRTEGKIVDQETTHIHRGFILDDQKTSVERLRNGNLDFS
jgi:hypothetical protein